MRRKSARRLVAPGSLLVLLACAGGDLTLPADAGSPTDLLLVSGDEQSAEPGDELHEPLVVRLVDEQGNGIPAGAVTWVVGAGGGIVSPATASTNQEGLASARLTLGPTPGLQTASAVVSGLATVTFSASATGSGGDGGDRAPHQLVFQVQPSEVEKDERITPPVVVAVVDRNGEVVPDFRIRIEVVLAGGEGKLKGHREVDTRDGLATFDDLEVDEPGEGKVLRAFAPREPFLGLVASEPFRVLED